MKILIYGAGVIGSIYAAKLFAAKNDVTLLARSKRFESLQQNGVITREQLTGKKLTARIPLIQQLETNDFYDLIIVAVRLDQLESIMPVLKNNSASPLIMFMLNNPENLQAIEDELKPKHVIFGFPGAGGIIKENVIDFIQIKQQKTTIGKKDGEKSETIKTLKSLFEAAGFSVDIS
ncbi:MAG: 2-dehydropantoate 2-reductase N-terminal domain-containing protein, partial [Ginsengibacter sp.]